MRGVLVAEQIPPFPVGTLEGVCKVIGDLYTGSELTRILAEVPLKNDMGEGITKWKRLAHAVASNQAATHLGNAVVRLVIVAMRPDRTLDRKPRADVARDELNQILSLVGYRVRDDGKVANAAKASTDSEAKARTTRMKTLLEQRGAHELVIAYCRPELVRADYYEAVFEAIKGLGSRLRTLTGVDADGHALVDQTMAGKGPLLKVNAGATTTDRNEQLGIANLAKGLFSAFRNRVAHEPRREWSMTEQDALDVLGTLSLVHRRLDTAIKS